MPRRSSMAVAADPSALRVEPSLDEVRELAREHNLVALRHTFIDDLVRTVEPLGDPNPDAVGLPDMALMLSDVLVVFDHLKHTITILVNVYAEDDADVDASYEAARDTIAKAKHLLAGPL